MDPAHASGARASVRQSHWRRILAVLRSGDLLNRLHVDMNARIGVESISWDRYWTETGCCISRDQAILLDALRSARLRYIENRFGPGRAAPYCRAYFALLRKVLNDIADEEADSDLLFAVLGLESTSIMWAGQPNSLAAVTSTARNPVYLLAKLRTPQAYEDPKFLPLIAAFDPCDQTYRLFYHYRQLSAGKRGGLRLLVYPPVDAAVRPEAFCCVHSFSAGLSRKQDTRAGKRAMRICDLAVGRILEQHAETSARGGESGLRIADLGAGSGDLTRCIVERLATRFPSVIEGWRLELTMVDVGSQNHRRHARHWPFFRKLSALRYRRSDYVSWIESQELTHQESDRRRPYDVMLLCQLLNNGSDFLVNWIDYYCQARKLSGGALSYHQWKNGAYLPHMALDQRADRTADLIVSNAVFRSRQGTVYRQLSLTDYFRGLYSLIGDSAQPDVPPEAVFFPVRRFNESALLMPDGSSIFEKLCKLAKAVIIEDVDLDARTLRRHFEDYGLTDLAATDATNRSKMHSACLLCVAERSLATTLPGRRIW